MSRYLVVNYGLARGPYETKMEAVHAAEVLFDKEEERFKLRGALKEWFGPQYSIYDKEDAHLKHEGFKIEEAYADWYDTYRDKVTRFTNGNIQFYTVLE